MDSKKMQHAISTIKLSEIIKQKAEEIEVLTTLLDKDIPAMAKTNLKQAVQFLNNAIKNIKELI